MRYGYQKNFLRPKYTFFDLKYTERFTLETQLGTTFAYTTYRLNSLYDPRYAALGGQPEGFDLLVAQQYGMFYVKSCEVTVKALPNIYELARLFTPPFRFGITPFNKFTFAYAFPTTGDIARLLPGTRSKLVSHLTNGVYKAPRLHKTYALRRHTDMGSPWVAASTRDSAYHSQTGNPTLESYVTVWLTGIPITDYAKVNFEIDLRYKGIAFLPYMDPDA